MDVLDAIRNRRSIRPENMDPSRPVDRATLETLLEAANWAPSHGLTEPWRFIVFEGAARRDLVEAAVSTLADPSEPPLAKDDPRRLKLESKMLVPPVIIAIICAPSDSPKILEHEEIASVAIAVQNMHLAAFGLGLGGFWTSGKKAFDPRVARFLELRGRERCLGFFYVGYPAIEWPEGARGPWRDKVSFRSR